MPPRTVTKSGVPKSRQSEGIAFEDLLLPRSLIARITKSILPENGAVQKEAVTAIQEAATVFISYICSAANDRARHSGRKAINAKDFLESLGQLEYSDFIPRLEAELEKLESAAADTAAKRKQNRPQAEDVVMPKSPTDMTGDSGPTPKRPRADNSQIHSALAEGERETIDSEDDEADEDLGEEVGEEVGDEVLEISGEEDVDEDMDEIDALTGGHASDEHVEIEDEAIDTSDSD